MDTWTAEWIATRNNGKGTSMEIELVVMITCIQNDIRANVRSAVRVFTGEAGVTFALS
jgi:hypothetical protein